MIAIGCTGGIGTGKSTVSAMLGARGAAIIDADGISRATLLPSGAGYGPTIERFGPAIVRADATLDRSRLAQLVFSDPSARRELEGIILPLVSEAIDSELESHRQTNRVVVVDHPLLIEVHGRERWELDGVIVVDTPKELAIARLVEQRGFEESDARARIAAQIERTERLSGADFIVPNLGSIQRLDEIVTGAWSWIEMLRDDRLDRSTRAPAD